MTSFGKPLPCGKWYKGLSSDSPVNHDILWRAQIVSEKKRIAHHEEMAKKSYRMWTKPEAEALKKLIMKYQLTGAHPDFKELSHNHDLQTKIGHRTQQDIEEEWAILLPSVETAAPPQGLPPQLRSLAMEVKLREAAKQSEANTATMYSQFAAARAGRSVAEQRVKAERAKQQVIRDRIERAKEAIAVKERGKEANKTLQQTRTAHMKLR